MAETSGQLRRASPIMNLKIVNRNIFSEGAAFEQPAGIRQAG